MEEQSQPSFDMDWNFKSYYTWSGGPGALSPSVNNGGHGEPKGYSGMVGTHHRPSDDRCVFCELKDPSLKGSTNDFGFSISRARQRHAERRTGSYSHDARDKRDNGRYVCQGETVVCPAQGGDL
jgi:hypothetical protein